MSPYFTNEIRHWSYANNDVTATLTESLLCLPSNWMHLIDRCHSIMCLPITCLQPATQRPFVIPMHARNIATTNKLRVYWAFPSNLHPQCTMLFSWLIWFSNSTSFSSPLSSSTKYKRPTSTRINASLAPKNVKRIMDFYLNGEWTTYRRRQPYF
jgi:hypothetical protein